MNGSVLAVTVWDPDGSGPQAPKLIVGGAFRMAGNVLTGGIAAYDPDTREWSALGSGLSGSRFGPPAAYALATLANGDLVAAGDFTIAGGVAAVGIARWDGAAWSPLGAGLSGGMFPLPRALAVLPSGELIAAGDFLTAGGLPANRIAKWDGTAWSPLGAGVGGSVLALAARSNGDVVAGGEFVSAGGAPAAHVARWNGTAWSALGGGTNGSVAALKVLPDGRLSVGGTFTVAGQLAGANRVAVWDGSQWSALGAGITGDGLVTHVSALAAMPDGDLVVGGQFETAGGIAARGIARWDGSAWSAIGTETTWFAALAVLPDGDLIGGGGTLAYPHEVVAVAISRWNGTTWSALSPGMNATVCDLAQRPNGHLLAAGAFVAAGDAIVNGVAEWDGTAWNPLGSGLRSGDTPEVRALALLPNGDVVAGGSFGTVGGVLLGNIARWDGAGWSALGSGVYGTVYALAVLHNGDVVAAGNILTAGGAPVNNIARWNGSEWSAMGGGMDRYVFALAVLDNGDLVAGGSFTTAGGIPARGVARWDGVAWSPLGSGVNGGVGAIAVLPDGDLVVGGSVYIGEDVPRYVVERWDGATWSPLLPGFESREMPYITALAVLHNGTLVAAGSFDSVGGLSARNIARWTGSTWVPLQGGLSGAVSDLEVLADGQLAAGGSFLVAGGRVSAFVGRYSFGAMPAIAEQPHDAEVCFGGTAVFTTAVDGEAPLTYRWRRGDADVFDGPTGTGSSIAGAGTATLRVSNASIADSGEYRASVSNSCGNVVSDAAMLSVCQGDFNCSRGVDSQDFFDYLTAFFAGSPGADFNRDGVVSTQDFFAFLEVLFAGCG